jgi:hypothetical protein
MYLCNLKKNANLGTNKHSLKDAMKLIIKCHKETKVNYLNYFIKNKENQVTIRKIIL